MSELVACSVETPKAGPEAQRSPSKGACGFRRDAKPMPWRGDPGKRDLGENSGGSNSPPAMLQRHQGGSGPHGHGNGLPLPRLGEGGRAARGANAQLRHAGRSGSGAYHRGLGVLAEAVSHAGQR